MTMNPQRPVGYCDCGDHAFVAITGGFVTIVSPSDAAQLRHAWQGTPASRSGYVTVTRVKGMGDGSRKRVILARELLGLAPGEQADHINRDPLDNRRGNLRPSTASENNCNRRRPAKAKSPYKGVRQHRRRWSAEIKLGGRSVYLGSFATAEEAASAYRAAAVRMHGQFARFE